MRVGFLKAAIIGGALFLVPVTIFALLIGKALSFMRIIAAPLVQHLPDASIGDIVLVNVLASVLLLCVCFAAGLFAQTRIASWIIRQMEMKVLNRIPFYLFIKSMMGGNVSGSADGNLKPIWVSFDDYSQLAFESDRNSDGSVIVYLPGSPNPWSGTVILVEGFRVKMAELSMVQAVSCLSHLGRIRTANSTEAS